MTQRPGATVRIVGACLVAMGVGSMPRISPADISPPQGFAWAHNVGISIVNLDRFPDHIFVAWPCSPSDVTLLQPYCVIRDSAAYFAEGTLYAVASKDVVLAVADASPSDGQIAHPSSVPAPVPNVLFVRPAIAEPSTFFARDRRVVRPGFHLRPDWISTFPANTGATGATYDLEIERVGPDGVQARFVRARYTCVNGGVSELAWEPGRPQAPVPRCPALNDRGEFMAPGHDPAVNPQGTAFAPRSPPTRPLPPFGPRLTSWIGGLLLSLGLLGFGLTLRKPRRSSKTRG